MQKRIYLNPIQVLFSHTERKRAGRVKMSTKVGRENSQELKVSAASSLNTEWRLKEAIKVEKKMEISIPWWKRSQD